jgi:protein-disulfide isomerase
LIKFWLVNSFMTSKVKIWSGAVVLLVVVVVVAVAWLGSPKPFYPDITSPRPMQGSAQAKIVIEEFSDFQCPYCGKIQPVLKDIITTFGDRIAFYFKHYPLVAGHPYAFRAALAAECANDQGKFWEYHDMLFANQNVNGSPKFNPDDLIGYARSLGLKEADFTACLNSRAKEKIVRADMADGDKRGIQGTPTFFINGQKFEFKKDYSELKDYIQGKLLSQ